MIRLVLALALGALAILVLPGTAVGQNTRYVSDVLEVPLRTGTTTGHRIVRMLDSGTPLTVVQVDQASGYSLVRTEAGTQGWVLSRYLMDTPSARERLEAAENAVEPLQTENLNLRQEIDRLQASRQESQAEFASVRAENQRLTQELAQIRRTAANAITIDTQNRELQEQVVNLESSVRVLQQENQILSDRTAQARFLMGAGVLFFGMIIGLFLPRLRLQKRNRWGDL